MNNMNKIKIFKHLLLVCAMINACAPKNTAASLKARPASAQTDESSTSSTNRTLPVYDREELIVYGLVSTDPEASTIFVKEGNRVSKIESAEISLEEYMRLRADKKNRLLLEPNKIDPNSGMQTNEFIVVVFDRDHTKYHKRGDQYYKTMNGVGHQSFIPQIIPITKEAYETVREEAKRNRFLRIFTPIEYSSALGRELMANNAAMKESYIFDHINPDGSNRVYS